LTAPWSGDGVPPSPSPSADQDRFGPEDHGVTDELQARLDAFDETLAWLGRLAEQTGSQVNGLAAVTGQLGSRLDKLGEDDGVDALRAALVTIEETVKSLAPGRADQEGMSDFVARLGATVTVLAEVTLPARFQQLDQTLARVARDGKEETGSLRAALQELNGTVAAIAQRDEQERRTLHARLDELNRSVAELARQEEQKRLVLQTRLDRLNDTVAALASRNDHERRSRHGGFVERPPTT
jgi:hypothetical protein